jgi:cytochrome c2
MEYGQSPRTGRREWPLSLDRTHTPVCGFLVAESKADQGNAENGEQVFKKCRACHLVGDGAKHVMGPLLTGVVGRPAGTLDGFRYSENLKQLAGCCLE